AASDAPWASVVGGTNMAGNGTGSLQYQIAPAPDAQARRATLTIAGQSLAIVQSTASSPTPPACTISATAQPNTFSSSGGAGTLAVSSTCAWTATADAWITGSVTQGNGTQSVAFQVSATTTARNGSIVVTPAGAAG